MTENQLQYVRKLMAREGITFMEIEYAKQFSHGRTSKLEDLFHHETQVLIGSLIQPSSKSKMKRKILSMAHEMNWELENGKIDFERLDAWCKKHTPYHKAFDEFTEEELPIVVSIFERLYKGYLKAI